MSTILLEEQQSEIPQKIIKLSDCPIKQVTVFTSSGLVIRNVKADIQEGEQKIIITGMSESTIGDSVRITGFGTAMILDVAFRVRKEEIKEDETVVAKRKELEEQKKNLQSQAQTFITASERLKKEREFIKKYSHAVTKVSKDDKKVSKLLSQESLNDVANFMSFYTSELERIDKANDALEKEKEDLENRIKKLEKEISDLTPKKTHETIREFHVKIEGYKNEKCELELSYRVTNASWSALYDVQVGSVDNSFKISYYGNVKQSTGEDWVNAHLALSTADPAQRSAPLDLPTLELNFKNEYVGLRESGLVDISYDDDDKVIELCETRKERFTTPKMKMREQKATVEQGATSTNFHVEKYEYIQARRTNDNRPTTIPSDGADHKVPITSLEFKPTFSHYTVPKKDTNAYIKVKTTNDSDYPLLPGVMNVFFDKNFIASGRMKAVSPKEEFESYLGVDPGVRVEYRTPKRMRSTVGVFKGSNKIVVERCTIIKNAKNTNVDITVVDQLPKSTDEKIKTKLIKPEVLQNQTEMENVEISKDVIAEKIKLLENNNIEWKIQLKPQQEVTIPLEYEVTWPSSSNLNIYDL